MIGIYFPITQGKFALVDREWIDYVLQYPWYYTKQGYAQNDQLGLLHQVIIWKEISSYYGVIDHKNDDKLDCRGENLRLLSKGQNRVASSKRKYKYKGVYTRKDGYLFASITVNKKSIHLGYHNTEEEAAKAYNEAAIKHFGEFAYLNKIDKEREMNK